MYFSIHRIKRILVTSIETKLMVFKREGLMRCFVQLITLSLFYILIPSSTFSQNTIKGRVLDESKTPLHGARVMLRELNRGILSDHLGFFQIENISYGNYHLQITYMGYEDYIQNIFLNENFNQDSIYEVKLIPTHYILPSIVVEEDISRSNQRQQSQSSEVIDQKFLTRNVSTNLISTLTRIPGINQINVGVGIAKPVIRGMSLNRISVVENGIKQEGQQWGSDHGLEIDGFNVEQIKILKGPSALIYGSDAIGGVIEIRNNPIFKDSSFRANLVLSGQSVNDNLQASVRAEYARKGKVFSARFSIQDYGDFSVPATRFNYLTYKNLAIYDGELKNTAGKEKNIALSTGIYKKRGYSRATFTYYHLNAGMFMGAFGTPRPQFLLPDGDNRNINIPSMNVDHYKLVVNNGILFLKNWLDIDLGFQRNIRKELATPHTHGLNYKLDSKESLTLFLNTFTLNARYHHTLFKKITGLIGINSNYQSNKHGGYEFFLSNFEVANAGIYIYEKYDWNRRWYVNAGIRSDMQQTSIHSYSAPNRDREGYVVSYSELVPNFDRFFQNTSFAMGTSYFPAEFLNLKLNLASNFRFPTPSELSAMGVHHGTFRFEQGNPNLDIERGYQIDFNLIIEREKWYLNISPFLNWFENYLYLSPTSSFSLRKDAGQIYEYKQTPALNYGGEITLDIHFFKNTKLNLGGDFVINTNRLTNLPLPFTPPASLKAELEYNIPHIGKYFRETFVSVESRWVDSQFRIDRNELETPSYHLMHFRLGTGFRIAKNDEAIQLFFQINNLFNRYYYSHLSRYRLLNIPEPGRNFTLTLKFNWN